MKPINIHSNRKGLLLALSLAVVMTLSACAGSAASSQTNGDVTGQTFTQDELALYDGLEGRKAYIAVDGVVYDVTDIPPVAGRAPPGSLPGRKRLQPGDPQRIAAWP